MTRETRRRTTNTPYHRSNLGIHPQSHDTDVCVRAVILLLVICENGKLSWNKNILNKKLIVVLFHPAQNVFCFPQCLHFLVPCRLARFKVCEDKVAALV